MLALSGRECKPSPAGLRNQMASPSVNMAEGTGTPARAIAVRAGAT
jgi:hypothetical protein